jgi:DNA modification methylase
MSVNSNYLIGDSRNIKEIFDEIKLPKPNVIVSSPPYFDVLNYNDNSLQIGFGQSDYKEYLNDVCKVFQSCYELSSEKASFWLIVDTFKKDGILKTLPFDIVSTLQSQNVKTWSLKEVIIWDKEKNLPWNGHGHFKNQFEYILFFSKDQEFYFSIDEVREVNDLKKWWKTYPERYNPNGKAPSNLWSFTTAIRGWGNNTQEHLCPLPFPLIEKILTISSKTGDTIFDPFAGSGSLLALAEIMGRNSIGIDVNEEYKELFDKQIKASAQEYWNRRESELIANKSYIIDFKLTNKVLRIHKVTSAIIDEVFAGNPGLFFKPVIYMFNEENSTYLLFLITNNKNVKIPPYTETTLKLIKQAKVAPEVKIVSYAAFIKAVDLKEHSLYKYIAPRIYSYTSTINRKTLAKMDNSVNHSAFYSIFPLKLK